MRATRIRRPNCQQYPCGHPLRPPSV